MDGWWMAPTPFVSHRGTLSKNQRLSLDVALSPLLVCLFFLLVRVAPKLRCGPLSPVSLIVCSRSYSHFIFPNSVYVASRYFQQNPPFSPRGEESSPRGILSRLAVFSIRPTLPPCPRNTLLMHNPGLAGWRGVGSGRIRTQRLQGRHVVHAHPSQCRV